MTWQIFRVSKSIFSFALTLELGIITILPTQASAFSLQSQKEVMQPEVGKVAEYIPPAGLGAPPATGGGTRSGSCPEVKDNSKGQYLTALMPVTSSAKLALTVEGNPQFFVYVPQTSARTAEFVLKDENENDVYRTTLPISGEGAIINVILPHTISPLEVDKNYHWYFSVICNPGNRRQDIFVDGWSRRIKLSSTLATELEKADPRERPNLYAKAGIWHEAVSTLAQLLGEAPNDITLATEWKKLLESAGLKQLADSPITLIASQE